MKRYAVMTVALLAAIGMMSGASVRWLDEVYDFGAFSEDDGDVECRFAMVNEGEEPVALTAVRASCGCTTPSYSRQPVAPGDTAFVTVKYNPVGRPGKFDKKVYVNTSAVDDHRTTLTIKGTVIGSAGTMSSRFPDEAGPLRLANSTVAFGDVTKGKGKNVFFKVYNSSDEPITISWTGLPDYLRVATNDSVVKPGEQTTFVFTATDSRRGLYGFVDDTINMILSPGGEVFPIEVMAMFSEDFSKLTPKQRIEAPVMALSTEKIDFGRLRDGEVVEAELKLFNRGKSPLEIRRVYSADRGVSAEVGKTTVKKNGETTIKIRIAPEDFPEEILNARLVVITNDPDNAVAIVRLVGDKLPHAN